MTTTELEQRQRDRAVILERVTPVAYIVNPQPEPHRGPLATFERLHPTVQLTLAICTGLGLPVALAGLVLAGGGLLTGLTTFALAIVAIVGQFLTVIALGFGIIILALAVITALGKL